MSQRLIKLPTTGIPSAWILKQIAFPPPKSYYQSHKDHYGNPTLPLISLEQQSQIRQACQIVGLCAVKHCGLPSIEVKEETFEMPVKLTQAEQRIIDSYDRQMRIEENMINMPDKIAQYKKDRRELKNKTKSDLPF